LPLFGDEQGKEARMRADQQVLEDTTLINLLRTFLGVGIIVIRLAFF
jgi:hypothetical protein